MKHFYAVLLLAALSMLAGGDTGAVPRPQAGGTDPICEEVMKNGPTKEMLAQQPCCAQNRGVCGCRAGRIVCCDNTFSPVCAC